MRYKFYTVTKSTSERINSAGKLKRFNYHVARDAVTGHELAREMRVWELTNWMESQFPSYRNVG